MNLKNFTKIVLALSVILTISLFSLSASAYMDQNTDNNASKDTAVETAVEAAAESSNEEIAAAADETADPEEVLSADEEELPADESVDKDPENDESAACQCRKSAKRKGFSSKKQKSLKDDAAEQDTGSNEVLENSEEQSFGKWKDGKKSRQNKGREGFNEEEYFSKKHSDDDDDDEDDDDDDKFESRKKSFPWRDKVNENEQGSEQSAPKDKSSRPEKNYGKQKQPKDKGTGSISADPEEGEGTSL